MNNVTPNIEPPVELLALIKYRLQSVAIGYLALRHSMAWEEPSEMSVYFDKKQVIEGKATGFTNGAIEAAVVHCRALLEFAGLAAGRTPITLREIVDRRNSDDYVIEQFTGLSRLSIAEAAAYYPGEAAEAEASLAHVIYLANKGLAHTTSSFTKHDDGNHLLEIAFRGVPTLISNCFYVARGVQPPDYILQWRTSTA
jgi:hypothetical protein